MRKRSLSRRGFTLTEVAIVLGIIGMILGAIWIAAAQVYDQKKSTDIAREMLVTFQNAERFYKGQAAYAADGTPITQEYDNTPAYFQGLLNAGVFPSDYQVVQDPIWGAYVLSPQNIIINWVGFYPLSFWGDTTAPQVWAFETDLGGLQGATIPAGMCIQLLLQLSQADDVIDLYTNNDNWGPVYGAGTDYPTPISHPTTKQISPIEATTACTGITDLWIVFGVPN